MKCSICKGEIDGKYNIYKSPDETVSHVCKACARKIEKKIIKLPKDALYIGSDTYDPILTKFSYRGIDIIGIPLDVNQSLYVDIMVDFLKDKKDTFTVSFISNKKNNFGSIYAEVINKNGTKETLFLKKQHQKCDDGSKNFIIHSDVRKYIINYKDYISNIIQEEVI